MKTFSEFQEEMNKKVPPVTGLGGGGGGTDSITAKSSAKSFKKRVGDVAKVLTFPFHKRRKDPTEKFATEGVMAIPVATGVASKVIPAAAATVGAIGTFLQAKKKGKDLIKPKKGEAKKTKKLIDKYKKTAKIIKPKEGEIAKQRELLSKLEKRITKPKKGEKKEASKTVKDFLKARKKEGETMYKLKQDAEIADKGPGDLLPAAKKTYLNKMLDNLRRKKMNEGVAALAVKGGSKLIPAIATGVGAVGTMMQARRVKKKRKIGAMEKRYYQRETGDRSNDMIRARRGEVDKQNKLIDKYEKIRKSQNEKNFRKNVTKGLKGGEVIQDEFSAPTNSMGGGAIAGSVEAGDNPPVKKKKRYIYGGTGSRKMWMNNK